MADAVLFTHIATAVRFGFKLSAYAELNKYYDSLKDRPSIKSSWPPHWKESELAPEKQVLSENFKNVADVFPN